MVFPLQSFKILIILIVENVCFLHFSSATEVEEEVAMETCVTDSFDVAESQEVEMQETVSPSDKDLSAPPSDDDGTTTDNKENLSVDSSSTNGEGGKPKDILGRKGDCYWYE